MRHSEKPTLPDLNVTGAWEMGYTGRGRVVTFLDDGLEYEHPDLKENYVRLPFTLILILIVFFRNRIKRLVLISMVVTMIRHLVMIQPMKTSKTMTVYRIRNPYLSLIDMEHDVLVKCQQRKIMVFVELVLPIMLELEVFECLMVMSPIVSKHDRLVIDQIMWKFIPLAGNIHL